MGKGASIAVLGLFLLGCPSAFLLGEEPPPTRETSPAVTSLTAQEASPSETGKPQAFNRTYSRQPSDPTKSPLEGLSAEDKTSELDRPVTVEILGAGRKVEGLADVADRLVDVRITNPNPYRVFFFGRQYLDNKTATLTWNTWKDGQWVRAGRDWCGTGVRDWHVAPGASIDVLLWLSPNLGAQQLLSTFYRADKPSVRSDCLLYERK